MKADKYFQDNANNYKALAFTSWVAKHKPSSLDCAVRDYKKCLKDALNILNTDDLRAAFDDFKKSKRVC